MIEKGMRCNTQHNGETIIVRTVEIEQRLGAKRGKWVCINEDTDRKLWRTSRQLHPVPTPIGLVTQMMLHDATDQIRSMAAWSEHGIEDGAVEAFIRNTEFHDHKVDPVSLAFGIAIGAQATRNLNKETA